jgi:hypothetical protein
VLNIVSENGGVLYIRQCFCFCTAHSATEHQKVNIFVLERTRTQRTEKPTMLICCSSGSNSREELSMEWTGDRSSRWPAARKACSSRRLSKGRWQEWSCSFNGVDEEWRFPRTVCWQGMLSSVISMKRRRQNEDGYGGGESCDQYRLKLLHL